MSDNKLTIALAGNPNSGKTTIFNNLTGAHQHVGNYPGVTVEKKEGFCRYRKWDLNIVDLPGTYSLTAFSPEEVVTRNFIGQDKCDVLVDVMDASNLERNLYLAVQLMELERPLVLVLNMIDVAEMRHIQIRDQILAQRLGVAVVRAVGSKKRGMAELLETAVRTAAAGPRRSERRVDYGPEIEKALTALAQMFEPGVDILGFPRRWLALKLLENDREIIEFFSKLPAGAGIIKATAEWRRTLTAELGDDPELEIANARYRFVNEIFRQAAVGGNEDTVTFSDRLDRLLTNRLLGLPVFLGMMWLVFNLVFTVGDYPKEWLDQGIKWLGLLVGQNMPDGELKSLLTDGVIGGVGSVIVFLPNVLLLFFAISLLEDTGYMARAAFIMDRIMRAVGLHGKSFIPLLLGFGCSVPAIMGTRTLENPRDRLVTMLVTPLMSCSARLPVYTVLIAAFFSERAAGNVLFSIYLLGIILAVVMARVFRSMLFPGESEPFVMELPPYRLPSAKGILIHMWERSLLYLQKAGTIILAVTIIIWFLTNYPTSFPAAKDYGGLNTAVEERFDSQVQAEIAEPLKVEDLRANVAFQMLADGIENAEKEYEDQAKNAPLEQAVDLTMIRNSKLSALQAANPALYPYASRYVELKDQLASAQEDLARQRSADKLAHSYAGRIGQAIEPILRPLGFDWKIGVGLFGGFTAKEVLVSTLGTIYSVGADEDSAVPLKEALAADPMFSPLVAYALMVFVLIYSPCLATIAIIKRETNSWRWPLFSSAYSTLLAWIMAFIVYQGGRILGLGN